MQLTKSVSKTTLYETLFVANKKIKTFLTISLLLFCYGQAISQECDVDSGFRGNRFSINRYEQRHLIKPVRNINELPKSIREKLYIYLNNKLGIDFAKKLKFDSGEYLNINQLNREFPLLYE